MGKLALVVNNKTMYESSYSSVEDICSLNTIVLAQKGNIKARDEVISKYSRLVVSTVKKYEINGSIEDAVQDGMIGLISALNKYNPNIGVKFSTYAYPWIKKYAIDGHRSMSSILEVPKYLHDAISGLKRDIEDGVNIDEVLSREDIEELGVGEKTLRTVLTNNTSKVSLNSIADAAQTEYVDIIIDEEAPSPEDLIIKQCENQLMREILESLSLRELEIIKDRYGFNEEGVCRTLREVAERQELSYERVRTIEKSTLTKLRILYESKISEGVAV